MESSEAVLSTRDSLLQPLATRVKALRESLQLRQDEFARRCGLSVSFVSLLERGERSPSYETLVKVAEALEVPLSELFRTDASTLTADPSHARLLEFARRAQLTRNQVDRFIAVGYAVFGIEPHPHLRATRSNRCGIEGCERTTLARGLCASHYHRARRARV